MEYDQISGKAIKKVFDSLIKSKTLIKLHLSGIDYEQLTVLTGFRRKLNRSFFLVGYAEGFMEAVGNKNPWEIDFEFTGPDKIPYSFFTTGGQLYQNQLCLPFPDVINREQRRKFFRLEAPDGTIAEFVYRQSECREHVVDISVGGALVAMTGCGGSDLPFQVGDVLEDLQLSFPADSGKTRVRIKKAVVVRLDQGLPNAATCCGLEFIEVDRNQITALTEFIYKFQRKCLRNRLRPDL